MAIRGQISASSVEGLVFSSSAIRRWSLFMWFLVIAVRGLSPLLELGDALLKLDRLDRPAFRIEHSGDGGCLVRRDLAGGHRGDRGRLRPEAVRPSLDRR